MKIGAYEITTNYFIIGGVMLAALVLFVYMSWPVKPTVTPQQVLNEALAVAQAPLLQQIEDQKKQVAEYKNQLSASQNRYSTLVTQYVDLEKRKANVIAPKTNTEIRDRFIALGFSPLAGK